MDPISQRPGRLDETALSMCNSFIIMRMVNPSDQRFVRNVIETLGEDDVRMPPDLDKGEAIFSGQFISFPVLARLRGGIARRARRRRRLRRTGENALNNDRRFRESSAETVSIDGSRGWPFPEESASRVWDPESPFYLADLTAIMVSYADFKLMPSRRGAAMRQGLREYLGVPNHISIYLDNGAFYFAANAGEPTADEYRQFIHRANPDWRPIRFDAIPAPQMAWQTQAACFRKTMAMNRNYQHDGYVPVVHAGRYLSRYIDEIERCPRLAAKECVALGGLVPNLLRRPKAAADNRILDDLLTVCGGFCGKRIHVFGIGGTATLHLAALMGFDSADSSGCEPRVRHHSTSR